MNNSTTPPVILITGASRGLGRGAALELAAAGYSVAIHYASNQAAAEDTAAQCLARAARPEQRFVPVAGNVGLAADRERIVAQTLAAFGRIDGLVNNAGVAPRERRDLLEATEESFEEVLRINLQGPHFLTQAVAQYWLGEKPAPLLAQGFTVIFVTSMSADTASVNRGEYCVSKAGLSMSAMLWAARLAGEGILVLELRPGIMATDMTAGVKEKYDPLIAGGQVPQRRWGTVQDVGRGVRAVLDGGFPFSAGAIIHLDGGLSLRRL